MAKQGWGKGRVHVSLQHVEGGRFSLTIRGYRGASLFDPSKRQHARLLAGVIEDTVTEHPDLELVDQGDAHELVPGVDQVET